MARIAVIDSDRHFRTVCAAVLGHFGHEVSSFEQLAEAAGSAAGFDLLVIDPG